ncbi:MAG TPA: MOSC N-terminal beta barrel domain-containing protein [Candidatus Koribacter sp.]|jgi:hypothetical protein
MLLGNIAALYRYPVKSMRGQEPQSAELGLHGLEGDRRYALRRFGDHTGFPWLTASQLFELVRFTPVHRGDDLYVRTPDGHEFPILSTELKEELSARYGSPIEIFHQRHGIFDDANLSIITLDTVEEIARQAGVPADVRRFRPNIAVRLSSPASFQEDNWLGGAITFGDSHDAPTISVTQRDVRCGVINLDPDTAEPAPELLKTVVRTNQNCAGIYATITRPGRLEVDQPIHFHAQTFTHATT